MLPPVRDRDQSDPWDRSPLDQFRLGIDCDRRDKSLPLFPDREAEVGLSKADREPTDRADRLFLKESQE